MNDERSESIETVFPEIEWIQGNELRQQAVATWEMALSRNELTAADLHRVPASLHLFEFDISLVEHTRGVTELAASAVDTFQRYYGDRGPALDRDIVVAGALLHDVGKVCEYVERGDVWQKSSEGAYVRHPFSGVALCDTIGVPLAVQHIVAVHAPEGDPYPRSPAAEIVHHADYLNFDPILATNKFGE